MPMPAMLRLRPLLSSPAILAPSRRLFSSSQAMRTLTADSLNPAIRNVEYAVRGELAIKAEQYRNQLKQPDHGLPFDRVISSNIGNPQQKGLDQRPISFNRQVSCAALLFLLRTPRVCVVHGFRDSEGFPDD